MKVRKVYPKPLTNYFYYWGCFVFQFWVTDANSPRGEKSRPSEQKRSVQHCLWAQAAQSDGDRPETHTGHMMVGHHLT